MERKNGFSHLNPNCMKKFLSGALGPSCISIAHYGSRIIGYMTDDE